MSAGIDNAGAFSCEFPRAFSAADEGYAPFLYRNRLGVW